MMLKLDSKYQSTHCIQGKHKYLVNCIQKRIRICLCTKKLVVVFLLFIIFKKKISSSSELLSNNSLFGGQL